MTSSFLAADCPDKQIFPHLTSASDKNKVDVKFSLLNTAKRMFSIVPVKAIIISSFVMCSMNAGNGTGPAR